MCPRKYEFRVLILIISVFIVLSLYVFGNRHTIDFSSLQVRDKTSIPSKINTSGGCRRWAVVAPVDSKWASEAVRRQVRLYDWCLVMVFDKTPPETYDTRWFAGEGNKVVVMLTPENIKYSVVGHSEFVKSCSWDHTGRKNIGYYYAIAHGADTIWEFHDDSMLKFWIPGAAPPGAPSIDASLPTSKEVKVLELHGHKWPTWNPYPAMGAPALPSWPRGLPIDDATNQKCGTSNLTPSTVSCELVAVLQSLSDHQPDADALYQAIMPFPYYFKNMDMRPVLVPPFTMSPYNEWATLHFLVGFWALYLPTTVDPELSDIWRSYIGQRLFWEAGLRVGFIGRPLVVQDRNMHYSLDKLSIKNTSNKLRQLIKFLTSWIGKGSSLIERTKELWLALQMNNFIGHKDVRMVELWLQSLTRSGYKFPNLTFLNTSTHTYTFHDHEDLDLILNKLFPDNTMAERYTARRNNPEYDSEVCQAKSNTQLLTFWTSDIHYGTRLDQPSFLGELGHRVLVAIAKTKRFRNPFVWEMKGMHLYRGISDVIRTYFPSIGHQNRRITEKMVQDNYRFYKNDSEIASVDAFLCSYQPGMCEMWMPFNKTIVFLPAHRYNMGRCTIKETRRLNEHLHTLARMDHPKHVISAASKYDLEYLRHYTGLEVLPLYSYSLYTTNNTYDPIRDEILIFSKQIGLNNWDDRFLTDITKVKLVQVKELYKWYSFSDLVHHRAVVFLPYAAMTCKMTELYSMSIPMFIPSMKYFQNLNPFGPDRSLLTWIYCKGKGPLKDSEMVPDASSIHPYSPNAMDKESEFYWLQLADFIQWPHITYFDDFKDLEQKLLKADFNKIHKLMVKENKRRRMELENNWCKAFKKIEKGRQVPRDYRSAIENLYGVTRLQVY